MTENKIEKISQPNSDTASTTGDTISVSKTLLIFDFDDTLFCTNYFDSFSLPYKDIFDFKVSLEQTNTCLFKEIEELEKNLLELFSKLQNNDLDIAIVSNADLKWINNCLIHFLPEFRDYIQENGIKIYSAKNIVSNDKNGNSKIKCFEKALNDVYSKEANAENEAELNLELNVIGIGDGIDEKKAVFSLCKNKEKFNFCQNIRAKFIRMIDYPNNKNNNNIDLPKKFPLSSRNKKNDIDGDNTNLYLTNHKYPNKNQEQAPQNNKSTLSKKDNNLYVLMNNSRNKIVLMNNHQLMPSSSTRLLNLNNPGTPSSTKFRLKQKKKLKHSYSLLNNILDSLMKIINKCYKHQIFILILKL